MGNENERVIASRTGDGHCTAPGRVKGERFARSLNLFRLSQRNRDQQANKTVKFVCNDLCILTAYVNSFVIFARFAFPGWACLFFLGLKLFWNVCLERKRNICWNNRGKPVFLLNRMSWVAWCKTDKSGKFVLSIQGKVLMEIEEILELHDVTSENVARFTENSLPTLDKVSNRTRVCWARDLEGNYEIFFSLQFILIDFFNFSFPACNSEFS